MVTNFSISTFYRLTASFLFRLSIRNSSASTANEGSGTCVEWRFALHWQWPNWQYLKLEGTQATVWSDCDSGHRSRTVFLPFLSATARSYASRPSVDLCLEQTRESNYLQLGRGEKLRNSSIGGCVCISRTFQIIVELPGPSECQQNNVIGRIETHDMPPYDIRSVSFAPSKSASLNRHNPVGARLKGRTSTNF
jgi:hypothetical protein